MLPDKAGSADGLILLGLGESFLPALRKMLEDAQFFKDFTGEEISVLANYVGAYEAKQGTWIFREGSRSSFMCLLVQGRVDIIKESAKKISTIRAGKTMGEMSIIDGFPYSASALAVEDSTLVYITRHDFNKLSEENAQVAVRFYRQIARLMSLRLRQTTGALVDYL